MSNGKKTISKKRLLLIDKDVYILVGMHAISLALALLFDYSPRPYIGKLGNFFSYDRYELVSALLTIWTVWTAVMIYYLGKKDEQFCGLSNWRIIFAGLNKRSKRLLLLIFCIDFSIILLGIFLEIKITLFIAAILLSIMTLYSFWIVFKSTDKETLLQQLKCLVLKNHFINEEGVKNECLEEIIHEMDTTDEKQLDMLLNILQWYLADILSLDDETKLSDDKELFSYRNSSCMDMRSLMVCIVTGIKEGEFRLVFFKNIVAWIQNEVEEERRRKYLMELLEAGMEKEEKPISFILGILASVKEDLLRRQLILDLMIYNRFIEEREKKRNRMFIQMELKQRINLPISLEDKKEIELFWWELHNKYSEVQMSMLDVMALFE